MAKEFNAQIKKMEKYNIHVDVVELQFSQIEPVPTEGKDHDGDTSSG